MGQSQEQQDRAALAPKFDQVVTMIKSSFTITTAPYLSYRWPSGTPYPDGARYLKDYRLWDKNDLLKINPLPLTVLDSMAELHDYAHLRQVLPNAYKGNVLQFAADVHAAFRARGLQHGMSGISFEMESPSAQPSKQNLTLEEMTKKAGKLANVALVSASDVLPVTVKSTSTMAKVA